MKKAVVIENKLLAYNIFELVLSCEDVFSFVAGQFINIRILDSSSPCFRAYSICSNPKNPNIITLCVKLIEGGRGSTWLSKLKKGDVVDFIGPSGNLTFKTPKDKTVFFVTTGTGIAPIKSIVEDQLLNKKNHHQKMVLLFGVRHIKDIFYVEEFLNLEKIYKNFEFHLVLSQPEDPAWKGKVGRVTNVLEDMDFSEGNFDFYVCGLKKMIISVKDLLQKKGVKEDDIYFEEY